MSRPFYMPLKQTKIYYLNRPSQEKFYLHAGDSGSNMNSPEHYAREVYVWQTGRELSGGFQSAFRLYLTDKVPRRFVIRFLHCRLPKKIVRHCNFFIATERLFT